MIRQVRRQLCRPPTHDRLGHFSGLVRSAGNRKPDETGLIAVKTRAHRQSLQLVLNVFINAEIKEIPL